MVITSKYTNKCLDNKKTVPNFRYSFFMSKQQEEYDRVIVIRNS